MTSFGVPKSFQQMKDRPKPGSFALEADNLAWIECRDTFRNVFGDDLDGIYFSHEPGEEENIAGFINKAEEILGVEYSSFSKTNRDFALWVEPSNFWIECPVRRSLMTILLRAGRAFKGNFEQALFAHKYVLETKNAVMRFMYGFTQYVPESPKHPAGIYGVEQVNRGWCGIFKNATDEFVRCKLVYPNPREQEQEYLIGGLWI